MKGSLRSLNKGGAWRVPKPTMGVLVARFDEKMKKQHSSKEIYAPVKTLSKQ